MLLPEDRRLSRDPSALLWAGLAIAGPRKMCHPGGTPLLCFQRVTRQFAWHGVSPCVAHRGTETRRRGDGEAKQGQGKTRQSGDRSALLGRILALPATEGSLGSRWSLGMPILIGSS